MAMRDMDLERALEIETAKGPPRQEAIALSKLRFGAKFQRDVDAQRVKRYARDFRPDAFGVIYVSERVEGGFTVIDGQHRVQTLGVVTAAGPDPQADPVVECLVYRGLTPAEEADLFRIYNGDRKQPTVAQIFNAALEAEDADALAIVTALAEFGLQVAYKRARDGEVAAIQALREVHRLGGVSRLREVLGVLKDSYGNDQHAYSRAMLRGLEAFLARYADQASRAHLVDALRRTDTSVIYRRIQALVGPSSHVGVAGAAGRALLEVYNRGLRHKLPEWDDPGLARRAARARR